jgi:hypothetical protein
MKTIIIFIVSIFCWLILLSPVFAQKDDLPLHYRLRTTIVLLECNQNGDSTGWATAPQGSAFSIVRVQESEYIIRFWKWTYEESQINALKAKDSLSKSELKQLRQYEYASTLNFDFSKQITTTRLFIIRKSDLALFASPIVANWAPTFGTVVLPFKYRNIGNDFTKDLTLSNIGGIKRNFYNGDISLAGLVGIGISSIRLDSANTTGNVLTTQDRAAITLPIGLVFQWNGLQVGAFMGWDWLSGNSLDGWVHQGKPWLSLGIGITLFSESSLKKNEENQK